MNVHEKLHRSRINTGANVADFLKEYCDENLE
jgi:hypothetical protein